MHTDARSSTTNESPQKRQKIQNTSSFYSMLNETQLADLIQTIVQAQNETYTKIEPSILNNQALTNLNFKKDLTLNMFFQRGLSEILKETKFLDYFNNLIENSVLFAKNVPYFMSIHESDRITLLKSCVFEIILVRHATCYSNSYFTELSNRNESADNHLVTLAAVAAASTSNASSATVGNTKSQIMRTLDNDSSTKSDFFWIPGCDTWTSCHWLCEKMPQLKKLIELLIEFYRSFSTLKLNEQEMALFCSYLLYNTSKFIFC